ncbi:MAG: hypothetical protein R3D00_27900 [Bacteroidia bacterium]
MKRFLLISVSALILVFTFVALSAPELPPIPEISEELSQTVDYSFEIEGMNLNEIELVHSNRNQPMMLGFKIAGSWETKRPSLYLTSIHQKPMMKADPRAHNQKGKGFDRFKKDASGRPVNSYTFSNTLVKDKMGKTYVKMVYNGPEMPMVGTLILERKQVFPAFVAKNFDVQGAIILKPGTYTLDDKINGFFIEVE